MTNRWKYHDETTQEQFVSDVARGLAARRAYAVEKYSTKIDTWFAKGPLDEAWEETLDLLFYLWKARLQRTEEQT